MGKKSKNNVHKHDPSLTGLLVDVMVDDIRCEQLATRHVAAVRIPVDIDGERVYIEGSSRKDPHDRPNDKIGLMLAYSRAFRSLSATLERRANGLVKHEEEIRQIRAAKDKHARTLKENKKEVVAKKAKKTKKMNG